MSKKDNSVSGKTPKADVTKKVEITLELMCCAFCGVYKKASQELGCMDEAARVDQTMMLNLQRQKHIWIQAAEPFTIKSSGWSPTCANAVLLTAYSQAGPQGLLEIIAGGVPQQAVEKPAIIVK